MIEVDFRTPSSQKDFLVSRECGLNATHNQITITIKDSDKKTKGTFSFFGFYISLRIFIPSAVEMMTRLVNDNQLVFYFKSSTDNLFHLYIVDTLTGNIIYEEHSINGDIYSLVISNNFVTFAINKGEGIFEWRCFSIRSLSYYPVNFKKLKHESFKDLGIVLATENQIDSIIINPKLEMVESKDSWNSGFFSILKNINK